jgi:photosystem II stability/assembly factor-like uncharacterized protein
MVMQTEKLYRGSIAFLVLSFLVPAFLVPAAVHAAGADWAPIPPGGSDVRVLAAVPGTATVFAGTAYGGVFRSFDRGASWSAANSGLSGLDVSVLAAGPAGSGTLYAGTEAGLFRSDDGAGSWLATGFERIPTAFAAALSAPATQYAADATAVFRSDDGGTSWTQLLDLTAVATPSALAVDAASPLHVYLGVTDRGGIYISRTGGAHWRAVALPGVTRVLGVAADPALPGTAFAATDGGVFVTRNGGGQWSLAAGLPAGSYTAVGFALDSPGTVYAATDRSRGRLWKSADSGATWSLLLAGAPFTAVAGDPLRPQRVYVAATPDGVFHGPLGNSGFSPRPGALAASSVTALAIDPRTAGLIYAYALLRPQPDPPGLPVALPPATFRVSGDGGATWQAIGGLPILQRLFADPAATGAAFALAAPAFVAPGNLPGSASTALWHTADAGATWQPLSSVGAVVLDVAAAAAATAPRTLFAAGYAVDPRLLPCPIGCNAVVAISTDGGATWNLNALPPVPIGTLGADPTGWFVRIDPSDPRTVYLGADGDLLKTVDGGASWSVLDANRDLADLAIDPQQPQRLYAVRSDGTLAGSVDAGQTWQPLGTGLPAGAVRRLAVGPGVPVLVLYAGTAEGVFTSFDRGVTWSPLGSGLPASVLALAVDPVRGTVYAGVEGGGGLFTITPPPFSSHSPMSR